MHVIIAQVLTRCCYISPERTEYKDGIAYIKSDYLEQFEREVEVTATPVPEDGADQADDGTGDTIGDATTQE